MNHWKVLWTWTDDVKMCHVDVPFFAVGFEHVLAVPMNSNFDRKDAHFQCGMEFCSEWNHHTSYHPTNPLVPPHDEDSRTCPGSVGCNGGRGRWRCQCGRAVKLPRFWEIVCEQLTSSHGSHLFCPPLMNVKKISCHHPSPSKLSSV